MEESQSIEVLINEIKKIEGLLEPNEFGKIIIIGEWSEEDNISIAGNYRQKLIEVQSLLVEQLKGHDNYEEEMRKLIKLMEIEYSPYPLLTFNKDHIRGLKLELARYLESKRDPSDYLCL